MAKFSGYVKMMRKFLALEISAALGHMENCMFHRLICRFHFSAYFFGGYGPKIRNSNEFTDGEFCAAIGSDGQSIWNNQLLSYNVKQ